jgi:hypothetical protein
MTYRFDPEPARSAPGTFGGSSMIIGATIAQRMFIDASEAVWPRPHA